MPWRPTCPQLGGRKTSFDGVVCPITKEISPFDACAPNVSLYDVSNSTPTSVTVKPEDVVFRYVVRWVAQRVGRLRLDQWCTNGSLS